MDFFRTSVFIAAVMSYTLSYAQFQPMSAERIGSRIDIKAGKKFVTSYRFSSDEKYPFFPRSIVPPPVLESLPCGMGHTPTTVHFFSVVTK